MCTGLCELDVHSEKKKYIHKESEQIHNRNVLSQLRRDQTQLQSKQEPEATGVLVRNEVRRKQCMIRCRRAHTHTHRETYAHTQIQSENQTTL